jgi:hypothetical protein
MKFFYKLPAAVIIVAGSMVGVSAQTISRSPVSSVSGATCPGESITYTVTKPDNACVVTWSVTNGTMTTNGASATVVWSDTPGAKGTLTATFSACSNSNNNGKNATKEELILSVKNQSWGSYVSSITLDYCSRNAVYITVPKMYVQGTGGIAQPALIEVAYGWTIPPGWREVGTNRTGFFGTSTNFIRIEPTQCALPGIVTVFGTLKGSGPFCNAAADSETATIRLDGANPVVSVGPEPGYTGASHCNTTPVTFSTSVSPSLGCINKYDWTYPSSWTLVSQSANNITLRPSGTQSDSGPISAKVTFACGSVVQSPTYTPPFKAPAISLGSANAICSGGTTVTLTNVGNAQVNWTTSSNMVITSGNGTTSIVAKGALVSTRDYGTISAQVVSCPGAVVPSKQVWIGIPLTNARYADGALIRFTEPNNPIEYNNVCNLLSKEVVVKLDGATSATWTRTAANPTIASWTPSTYWSAGQLKSSLRFYFFQVGQTATFRLNASNSCGSRIQDFSFKSINCSGNGGGCPTFAVSPNPSSNTLSIIVPNIPAPCPDPTTALQSTEQVNIKAAYLYTIEGQLVKEVQLRDKTKRVDIDITDLKENVYILKIYDGTKIETHRIVKD